MAILNQFCFPAKTLNYKIAFREELHSTSRQLHRVRFFNFWNKACLPKAMRQTAEGIQSLARWEVQGTKPATPGTVAGELGCPKLVGDEAPLPPSLSPQPIRKLSAKNLLLGLTGKVINLAGKAKQCRVALPAEISS